MRTVHDAVAPIEPTPARPAAAHSRGRRVLRVVLWSTAGLFAAIGVFALVARLLAPGIVRRRLIAAVRGACPTCTLEIGRVELGLLRGRVVARSIVFTNAPAGTLRVDVYAESALVELRWGSLLAGHPHLTRIVIDAANLTLQAPIHPGEGWSHPTAVSEGSPLSGLPPLRIDRLELHRGEFTYREMWPGRSASIDFAHLEGVATDFATRRGMVAHPTVAVVTGEVERSGRGRLRVETDLLAASPTATIEASLNDQDLAAFRAYLVPIEGAHLSGRLHDARAVMHLARGSVSGQLSGSYHGLAVSFERTREHGTIETAMNNLGATIQVAASNDAEAVAHRATPIARSRGRGEPLIGFLWVALRDACLQLILRDGRRS